MHLFVGSLILFKIHLPTNCPGVPYNCLSLATVTNTKERINVVCLEERKIPMLMKTETALGSMLCDWQEENPL